jgi:4-hydroxybenzoate polyprenyltransferase
MSQALKKLAFDSESLPVCVDLDDTLILTDTLFESTVLLIKKNPAYLFLLPFWFLRGKVFLKNKIASLVDLRPESLVYNLPLLALLKQEHGNGTKLHLITGTANKYAQAVAAHLGLFSSVIATAEVNLVGRQKLKAIKENFGDRFKYIGDNRSDVCIFKEASEAVVVTKSVGFAKRVSTVNARSTVIMRESLGLKGFVKAMRVHQWAKNCLIFTPLMTSHSLFSAEFILKAVWAFFAFSLCASGTYILNDIFDLEADRDHPRKKNRPVASGRLSIKHGIALAVSLLATGFLMAAMLSPDFFNILAIYLVVTATYTMRLKQVALADVLTLASLYTLRIFAGSLSTGIKVSDWLLAFSMFVFISLAYMKRYSELHFQTGPKEVKIKGRGYLPADLVYTEIFGAASGLISVLVFILYIHSQEVKVLYKNPQILWFSTVFLFYWVSNLWLTAHRGEMEDDPIAHALRDKTTYIVAVCVGIVILLAK